MPRRLSTAEASGRVTTVIARQPSLGSIPGCRVIVSSMRAAAREPASCATRHAGDPTISSVPRILR